METDRLGCAWVPDAYTAQLHAEASGRHPTLRVAVEEIRFDRAMRNDR